MKKIEDKDTRYYIDLDLKTGKILSWDYDQRQKLVKEEFEESFRHRIYMTKGQYYKLVRKASGFPFAI